jgi:K+-transporting ATPase ATPase A chain
MGQVGVATLYVASLAVAVAVAHRPVGDFLHRVLADRRHSWLERGVYRLAGVDPAGEQSWAAYARGVLAFSAVSVLVLYGLQRLQHRLWLSTGLPAVPERTAWNTAVSFVTNTNWQSYAGEQTMGHLVQTAGLAVQNFTSAAVGVAVAGAVIRGFARRRTHRLGNFWVDLTRIIVRVLLPVSVLVAVVLVAGGVVQSLTGHAEVVTLTGGTALVPGGPVASQEAIKTLGTNGGGFFNANSAHPFENPAGWTNWLQILLLLVIPFSLPRVFARMVGDLRQGYALVAVMALLALASVTAMIAFELAHQGTVPQAVGASLEGKEVRFGVAASATFAAATTLTSGGSVDSVHDSYTALGGGVLIANMLLGEVAPGGVGSGLYGLLVLAVITVFLSGLLVGRTPEYLGKRIGARQVTLASLFLLTTPALVLIGAAAAMANPAARESMLASGPHGLSEVLYAYASAGNNNGSAFAGLDAAAGWYEVSLGVVMLLGRFVPMILVLALAGSLARQQPVPVSAGTLRTGTPLFAMLLIGVTVLLVALTYLPVLALGPLAEGLR